jgi:cytochrome d ubiquinol oxidase subunit I
MMGLGFVGIAISALVLWATRPVAAPRSQLAPKWWNAAVVARAAAAAVRELVRLDLHRDGPPAVDRAQPHDDRTRCRRGSAPAEVAVSSMVVYTLLYAALAVVEVKLFLKYVRLGAEAISDPDSGDDTVSEDADAPLAYAY